MIAGWRMLGPLKSLTLAFMVAGCASQATCLYPSRTRKNQYLVLFPRYIVARADDPRDETERHRRYVERLNSYFQRLQGAETCRARSFHYYEGGGIGAVAECAVSPPLKLRAGSYNADGSPAYMTCYPANGKSD